MKCGGWGSNQRTKFWRQICDGGEIRKRVALKKKVFDSLRLCVSSLHRDQANLLCIFKRLFNVAARRQDNYSAKILIYKLYVFLPANLKDTLNKLWNYGWWSEETSSFAGQVCSEIEHLLICHKVESGWTYNCNLSLYADIIDHWRVSKLILLIIKRIVTCP